MGAELIWKTPDFLCTIHAVVSHLVKKNETRLLAGLSPFSRSFSSLPGLLSKIFPLSDVMAKENMLKIFQSSSSVAGVVGIAMSSLRFPAFLHRFEAYSVYF